MKLQDVVVYSKLFCVFVGTSLLTLQTGLGQWSNADDTPSKVQWVMIIGGNFPRSTWRVVRVPWPEPLFSRE